MNEATTQAISWQATITETYQELTQQVINHAPQIIGAIALLVLGYIIAVLLRIITQKLVQGLDSLFKRAITNDALKQERLKESYALIIGKFVFWLIFIFFIAASANLLGWKLFSGLMNELLTFLPSLLSGLFIVLAGYLIGNLAYSAIVSAGVRTGSLTASTLARSVQIIIVFSFVIIGIEQIGINVTFLTSMTVVISGILLAGAALAFSLGAKNMVANLIGAQYACKHCNIGERIKLGEFEGEILEITQTSIVLDTNQGRVIIPAKSFHEQSILLNPEHPSESDYDKRTEK